jgi:hypothetical protein
MSDETLTKKELTREEQIQLNVKRTLESKFIQAVVGGNSIKANPLMYGQASQGIEKTYDQVMEDEEANKMRKEIYQQKKQEGDQLGVIGEPAYPSNYDISLQIMKQVQSVMSMAKLDDLESIVKSVAKDLDFEVPKMLKDYSAYELMLKAQEGEELSKDEQMALGSQQLLSQAYTRAVAFNVTKSNYFVDLNDQAGKIMDSYKENAKSSS